ncbi:autotransporter assembly complex protein TamA [Azospirillum halopraeferens]|uniref:autotransporter assembly complex protein TamA n=1 Tax=Azospirillum halopraeferens TaxID=34010 RepID=UPI000410A40D|nr:autotransporter assembly complex family protein [Azospirillum halopraeferens]
MTATARSALLLAGAFSAALLTHPAAAREADPHAPAEPAPAALPPGPEGAEAAPSLPYAVRITGVDEDLLTLLESASTLVDLQEDPPPTLLGLERRADADRDRLQTALRSAGYYDARLDIRIGAAAAPPVPVTIAVETGPAYTFDAVAVRTPDGRPLPGPAIAPADLGLVRGERARAPLVVAAEERLLSRLGEQGFAFAAAADRRVVVDHDRRTMDITYTVDAGPLVRFGAARVEGLEEVDEDLVRGRLPWQPGEEYRPELVDRARQSIAQLEVFDTVRVSLADAPGPDGVTPVTVSVVERKRRFIGAGVFFSTAEGLGTQAYWGHRNLFGGAEYLRIGAQVGRLGARTTDLELPDLQFNVRFRKPDFLAVRQTLAASFSVVAERPPAYERVATILAASLEREITDNLRVGYGLATEWSRTRTDERTYQSVLVGAPLSLNYDASDNLLNPTRGYRVALVATPWYPVGGDTRSFFAATGIIGTAYHDIAGNGDYVAAGRINVSSILGAGLDEIPPDKRYYAGGGGSVRGYGFQKVGPRNANGDPSGGRSLVELGLEMRVKVTDTIGIVPFVDAGMVYDSTFPTFADLKVGAGLGLRYYTDFGPLRVDVGFPLNPDSNDARWQLYLSLGQAF